MRGLAFHIAQHLKIEHYPVGQNTLDEFAVEIADLNRRLPRSTVSLRPAIRQSRDQYFVDFDLVYDGTIPIELIEVRVSAPIAARTTDFILDAQRHILSGHIEGDDHQERWVRTLNTNPLTNEKAGIEPLPGSFATSPMSPRRLKYFFVQLSRPLAPGFQNDKLITTVSVKRYPEKRQEISLGELFTAP